MVTMVVMMELVIVKLVSVDEVLIVDVGWLVSWLAGWLLFVVVGWLVSYPQGTPWEGTPCFLVPWILKERPWRSS